MNILTPFRVILGTVKGLLNYARFVDSSRLQDEHYLFVDVTEVRICNSGTGVPRVTNNILQNLYECNLPYKIIEVYGKSHFEGFIDCKTDKPIRVAKGDFFFGLDFSKFQIPKNKKYLDKMYALGIPVWFFVHDLIPYYYPQYCTESVVEAFNKWLKTIVHYTGFIAHSETTMNETINWLHDQQKDSYNQNIKYGFVHLGTNFNKKMRSVERKNKTLQFLAVGTVEPRKKYDQIIFAFELLLKKGYDISLHIVGRPGWNNENVFHCIKNSVYFGTKIFWHETFISDEDLEHLYSESCALIFASEVEGFGIPLVEAAAYNIPLIVRDIPVFKEVVGKNAFYFSGFESEDLARKIEEWIFLYKNNSVHLPCIKLFSWKETTAEVCNILELK